MCITRNDRTRFACGHSENTSSTTECQDYIEIGECANTEIIWMGSNTSRNRVCSACIKAKKKDSGKKEMDKGKKEEKLEEDQVEEEGDI